MVSSFSKSHAMTGFRVGYAISDKSTIDKISKIQAIAITSVAEPMQYAAVAALDADVTKNKI
jgi:Aspartate/tyrosine/aromatic aminotransferase